MDSQGPGLKHEPAPQPDDLHIEVGELDLPARGAAAPLAGSAPGDMKPLPWYRQSVTVPRPVVAAGVLALVVLAALAALFVHPASTATATEPAALTRVLATPTPSPFPTPTLVAPPIGAVPGYCTLSPTGPFVGGRGGNRPYYAAGSGPVWVDGFDGSTAIISITQDAAGPYSEYGWPVYTALALKDPFEEPVTVRGSDLRIGAPLWFTMTGNDGPATGVTAPQMTAVDPQQFFDSGGSGAHWWNGMMYLPGAGCYALQASWPGGGWTVHSAAGR